MCPLLDACETLLSVLEEPAVVAALSSALARPSAAKLYGAVLSLRSQVNRTEADIWDAHEKAAGRR